MIVNTEIRFIALVMLTIITIYVMMDTQKENKLSLEIQQIRRVITKMSRNNTLVRKRDNIQVSKTKKVKVEEKELKWLDRSDSKPYRNYGDDTCGINTDRMGFMWLLRKWTEIAKKHNTRYFLSYGSLFGAWRTEDVIPYDADTDIHVHNDDLESLFNLSIRVKKDSWDSYDDRDFHLYFTKDWRLPYRMRRRFSCKGKQVYEYEGQCSFTDPIARLIYRQWHLDLFVYIEYHDTLKILPEGGHSFLRSDFLPVVKCDFMGIECRCPRKPKVFLEYTYSSLYPSKICSNKTWVNKD